MFPESRSLCHLGTYKAIIQQKIQTYDPNVITLPVEASAMLHQAMTGVRENLWPQQWVYSVAVTDETFQQLCSLFNLIGRDYTDAIVDSTLACARLFANWKDVEKARDIEKAFSHFAGWPGDWP